MTSRDTNSSNSKNRQEAANAPREATARQHSGVRSVDLELLRIMQGGQDSCVCELTDSLGVTATAIRQRIERLMSQGLIERTKKVSGRGRPTFQYRITEAGKRACGANPIELTQAIWQAVMELDDPVVRESILHRAALSMGKRYAESFPGKSSDEGSMKNSTRNPITAKLAHVSREMQSQDIQAEVGTCGDLPVLDITSCPYPSLSDRSGDPNADRSMCRLEEKMLSEALGTPVHLSSCRLDGDACCQFTPST